MSRVKKGITTVERTIVVYTKSDKDCNKIITFDGKKKREIPSSILKELKQKPYDFDEVFVKFSKKKRSDTLESFYKDFIKDADELKDITDGKVNLYKSGSYVLSSIQLFYDFLPKDFTDPEQIEDWEADILNSCSVGALRYANNNYEGKGYKYDIVSSYPSIMSRSNFPMKKGKLLTITQDDLDNMKNISFGCYRCKISNFDRRVFKENKENWYCFSDVSFAIRKGYDVEMIEDDEPNVLSYENCLTSGKKLFGKFVEYLFNLKKQGYKSPKKILNCLWGALCQRNTITMVIHNNNKNKLNNKEIPLFLCPDENNGITVEFDKLTQKFQTNYGRIKPFMLSSGRMRMAYYLEKSVDDLIYSHTDGFVLSKRLKTNDKCVLGDELGNLHYEGKCKNILIENMAAKLSDFKFQI